MKLILTDCLLLYTRNESFLYASQKSQTLLFGGHFRSLAERAEYRKCCWYIVGTQMSDGRLAALIGMLWESNKSKRKVGIICGKAIKK